MNETVTLQTLLIAIAPFGVLLLTALFASALGGGFEAAVRRLRGHPSRIADLEQRVASLETAIKRARASALPLAIEAERLAEEIQQIQTQYRPAPADVAEAGDSVESAEGPASPRESESGGPAVAGVASTATGADMVESAMDAAGAIIDLPRDPDETEEDRLAREQLEAEERERIARLAADEERARQEREEIQRRTRERIEAEAARRREEQEERDRIEREQRAEEERAERARLEAEAERKREQERIEAARLEAEAERKREQERLERERQEAELKQRQEEEQRRKAEEFRRRVADATPKIVMSAGGSNREGATINIAVTNNITPKRAEIAVLTTSWAATPTAATFETQRKDGLFEEFWPKQARATSAPAWGTYEDASGRTFPCPEDAPTSDQAWIVISYERNAGGPAATWQRFEVSGAGALWYIRQPVGDPILIEASRADASEAAA